MQVFGIRTQGLHEMKTCKLKDVSFQCMTKFTTNKKKKKKKEMLFEINGNVY